MSLEDTVYNCTTPADELSYYQRIAGHYEKKLKGLNYTAPELCCQALKIFEENSGISVPRDGKCLDIGAGTGMSGESVRSAGFTGQVDALEPSDNMYYIAEQKGIYTTRYAEMLSPDKETSVPGNSYDLVLASGVFNNRSATSDCFPEAVRVAKSGGILTIVMNNDYWEGDFELVIKELEEKKLVEVKHTEAVDGYYDGKIARVLILYKL